MQFPDYLSATDIANAVSFALAEDIGNGDITAQLIPADTQYQASVITREPAIICGQAWVEETFRQVDPALRASWNVAEGDYVAAGQELFTVGGPARSILTAERSALNWLQMLSGTATLCHKYTALVASTQVKLLDTRKTIPGLRRAQKYAVTCGGCFNHRIGLYDAYLIKENHIAACGSIANAVKQAKNAHRGKTVEIEVESLDELQQALDAQADIIMLDNFSIDELKQAVSINNGQAKLEASGNISEKGLQQIAATGVDYISIGALTKNIQAIDLSMRMTETV